MNLNVNSVNHFIGVLKTYNECLKMSESYFQNIRLQSKSDQCMWPIWGYPNHYSDQYVLATLSMYSDMGNLTNITFNGGDIDKYMYIFINVL